jgi:hypothetical protein
MKTPSLVRSALAAIAFTALSTQHAPAQFQFGSSQCYTAVRSVTIQDTNSVINYTLDPPIFTADLTSSNANSSGGTSIGEGRLWAEITPGWVVASLYGRGYISGVTNIQPTGTTTGSSICYAPFTVAQDTPFRFTGRSAVQVTRTPGTTGRDNFFYSHLSLQTGTCHLANDWDGYVPHLVPGPGTNSFDTNGIFLAGQPYVLNSALFEETGTPFLADGFVDTIWTIDFALILNPNNPPNLFLQTSPTNLSLQWPAFVTNVVLEAATNLAQPDWEPVTNEVQTVGGVFQVTTAYDYPSRFFRLRQTP